MLRPLDLPVYNNDYVGFLLHGYKINVQNSIFYCILSVSKSVTYIIMQFTSTQKMQQRNCISFIFFLSGYDGCFEPSYASESAAAIITMVLQHTDNGCKLFLSVLKHILPHLCSF